MYLFWADTFGKLSLVWPKDLNNQSPVKELWYPDGDNPNKWETIDANRGVEMALAAVSDKPMNAEQIKKLTSLRAFTPDEIRPDGVYHFASEELQREISRGLAGVVESQKNPISAESRPR